MFIAFDKNENNTYSVKNSVVGKIGLVLVESNHKSNNYNYIYEVFSFCENVFCETNIFNLFSKFSNYVFLWGLGGRGGTSPVFNIDISSILYKFESKRFIFPEYRVM